MNFRLVEFCGPLAFSVLVYMKSGGNSNKLHDEKMATYQELHDLYGVPKEAAEAAERSLTVHYIPEWDESKNARLTKYIYGGLAGVGLATLGGTLYRSRFVACMGLGFAASYTASALYARHIYSS